MYDLNRTGWAKFDYDIEYECDIKYHSKLKILIWKTFERYISEMRYKDVIIQHENVIQNQNT